MAIIKKDKFLKDIATRIGRGQMYFEMEDRPSLMMGGRQVYVSSVGYDNLSGEMAFSVSNSKGEILSSARGIRRLADMDAKSLSTVCDVVNEYASLRAERTRNLVNMETRMRQVTGRRPVKGVTI